MIAVWRDRLGLAVAAALVAAPAVAEEASSATGTATEEIVVTGSYIRGTPEDAALPVDVTTAADLQAQGNPNLIEIVRNLAYTSGNLAETNQFGSSGGSGQGTEGVQTINLRGLGGARTLVLLNGRRHVPTETIGVDINVIPSIAIGRIETLKDGAAALYGSDAIGGVVNLITREGFEGLELRASEQFIDESNGDHEASFIFGSATDSMNYFVAGEWAHRSELTFRDREWGLIPFERNPQGGWSAIANPPTIFPVNPANPTAAGIIGAQVDPECTNLGGANFSNRCRFQYTQFDNITEDQDNYKAYGEINFTLANGAEWHTEGLYSKMDQDEWKTSPSYPPQSLFGPDRYISPGHPALIDLKARYPQLFPAVGPITRDSQGAFVQGRMIGVEGLDGRPQTGTRETEQRRFATSLSGTFADAFDYDLAVSYSERTRSLSGFDMYVERMAFALDGLGGPNCNQSTGTPGAGGCLWFNPFSTAIQQSAINGATNPNFSAANDNPRELLDWMVGKQASEATNELLVFDAVVSGETPIDLGAGAIGWAAGFQARDESYNLSLNELTNLAESPCQFNNPRSVTLGNVTQAAFDNCQNGLTTPTGPLAFLAGTVEEKTSRTIYAFFGELAIPVTDTIDMQAAIRFEDYGSETGSTVDPKVAIRWQALDWLAFRGTAQTTFRGPPQSLLSGRGTALAFIAPAAAFKAVDTLGNPNLSPESAVATNLGVLFDVGGLYASVDWWRYELEDPISLESQDQIVSAYSAQGCQNGGAGAPDPDGAGPLPPTPTPSCEILRSHIFPLGTSVAALERVERNWINGADIDTSGIDAYVQYTFEGVLDGELTIGAQGSYTFEYESKDFLDINGLTLAPGGDFMGALNDGTPFTPKPDLKGDAFVKFTTGPHTASLIMRYVSDYDDKFAPTAAANGLTPDVCCDHLKSIDEQITFDAHYVVSLMEDNLVLSFSAINFTDEDPPLAATDLNYDPFTHDARGIILKAGVQYRLGD